MTKLEKVIDSFGRCTCHVPDACRDCAYDDKPAPDCWQSLERDALELLKEREWISVKDRLPEENKAVNVVWVNREPESYYQHIKDKPFVASAVFFRNNWYWWNATIEDVLAEYGRSDFDLFDESIEVTHWMPLPEPPMEGDGNDEA